MKWLVLVSLAMSCRQEPAGESTPQLEAAQVTGVSIEPASPRIASARPLRLTATATLSDGSKLDVTAKAAWSSTAPAIATVTPGVLHGIAPGSTTITAGYAGATASVHARVTAGLTALVLEPATVSLVAGHELQLTAIGGFADGSWRGVTLDASWTTSDPAIAAVEAAGGFVRTRAPGQVTITATIGEVHGAATVAVSPPTLESLLITTTASNNLTVGDDAQITAIGTLSDRSRVDLSSDVTWVDDNPGSLSISPTGAIHAIEPGPIVYISARRGAVSSNVISFNVFRAAP
jgi:uncharacterized protein YjdB